MLLKTAIVTGGTGFLGCALVRELIRNDIFVYALCRKGSKRLKRFDGLAGIEVLETDLSCPEIPEHAKESDVFYHLAWEGGRNDFDEQYKNVSMTVSCLKLASAIGCMRFISTGTQAEYGETTETITEESSLNPSTAYGACKVAAYYLSADLAKRSGIEHIWARVFSIYGPSDNPNTLIMTLIRDARTNREVMMRTDGEHIWNYLYEDDAARALRLLGTVPNPHEVYNVASLESKPLKDFANSLIRTVDSDSEIYFGNERSSVNLDIFPSKLIEDIGEFEFTNYIDGIRRICANV